MRETADRRCVGGLYPTLPVDGDGAPIVCVAEYYECFLFV